MQVNRNIHTILVALIEELKTSESRLPFATIFLQNPDISILFERSLETDDEELFEMHRTMASDLYSQGVVYSQYSNFINSFTSMLINKAAIIVEDTILIERINLIQNIVLNAIAKAYLLELISEDIPLINQHLDEYVAIEYINAHLHWMKKIIFDIETEANIASVELNPKKCNFGKWLATKEIEQYFSISEVHTIHKVHHTIHSSGKSLYSHLKSHNYTQIIIDYLFLSRTSINLVSRINAKVTHQVLSKVAETDPLTQVNNRHSLEASLQNILSVYRVDKISFAVAMVDIDYFKKINDTFGHQVGDYVLVTLAAILKKSIRTNDLVFRYGGEEFLLLLRECDLENSIKICEKIRHEIESYTFEAPLDTYSITASFGIALADEKSTTIEDLINRADENLYKAKESGRNRVVS